MWRRVFGFFSSIKLAVFLILGLAALLAVGTFYEAENGTAAAQRVIYKSWFVHLEMLLLVINLSGAALDRYPWKKHHIGFVITHLGIITLIAGSFITQQKGIDGNIALGVNETTDNFFVPNTELHIYQSLDGKPFALIVHDPVDFEKNPPEKKSYDYKLVDDDHAHVLRFIEKAQRKTEVIGKNDKDSSHLPSLRFRIYNDKISVSEWLGLDKELPPFYDLGPATITFILGPLPKPPSPRNQIVIFKPKMNSPDLRFAVFSNQKLEPIRMGPLKPKTEYATGWMNLKFSVIDYFEHAEAITSYVTANDESKDTTSAVEIEINGNRDWFELENPHEVKADGSGRNSYFVSFTRKKYELGFDLTLKKFKLVNYGGSQLPASYESTVSVDHKGKEVISMNNPLKNKGYTIYQSSYESDQWNQPALSVFSVNFDPGRPFKYAGALCIVGGIGTMFYWKPKYSRKPSRKNVERGPLT